jgi:uncharacterized membrane protein
MASYEEYLSPFGTDLERTDTEGRPRPGAGRTASADGERLAAALGWFSVGLGLAQITMPDRLSQLIGVRDDDEVRGVMQALGMRELATGVGMLTQSGAGWAKARVGGDLMDLAMLGSALSSRAADRRRLAATAAAVAGVTALDLMCSAQLQRDGNGVRRAARQRQAVSFKKSVTINKPVEQVYAFWRDFQNLPRFMRHLDSVTLTGDRRSHWAARAPAGTTVEWDAEMTEDRPNERIAWRSLPGSSVNNWGAVTFRRAPGNRGTEIHVSLHYEPPAGALGRTFAWLFGEEPEQQVADDLRRFKQLIETGEIPLSEGPGLWRPAQPPEDPRKIRELAGVHL